MTLTPLTPMGAAPQVQQGSVPVQATPQPMQPAHPWMPQVQAGFQQAYHSLDPIVAGISGAPTPSGRMTYGTSIAVVPPGREESGDTYGGTYLKEGSPFRAYNDGVDQGQQTEGYKPMVGPGGADDAGQWTPYTKGSDPAGLGPVDNGHVVVQTQPPVAPGPSQYQPNPNPLTTGPNPVHLPSDGYAGEDGYYGRPGTLSEESGGGGGDF